MKIHLDGLEKIAELSPQKEYYDIFDRQTALALIEVVKASKALQSVTPSVYSDNEAISLFEDLKKALESFE